MTKSTLKKTDYISYKDRVGQTIEFVETILEGTDPKEDAHQGMMIISQVMSKLYHQGYCQHVIKDITKDSWDSFKAMTQDYLKDNPDERQMDDCEHDEDDMSYWDEASTTQH